MTPVARRISTFVSLVLSLSLVACQSDHEALEGAYFEDAYERANDPSKADAPCNGVGVPDQRGFEKRVALTFDDGPNPATTPRIVEMRRATGVIRKPHARLEHRVCQSQAPRN